MWARDMKIEQKVEHAMHSVLVVEDNPDLMETLSFTLARGGFSITKAVTGKEALTLVDNGSFDLVILDVCLPDASGFMICHSLRERSRTKEIPIIFLSARAEEIDKVMGFEVGADDYITKPFSVKELILRMNAVLRRKRPVVDDDNFSFGMLRVHKDIPKVFVCDKEVFLTSLELRLLFLLYSRKGRVQTRTQLLNHVWKIEADITTRTVDTHIKRLREKLLEAGHYILTVRGIGYRFITEGEITSSSV